ANKNINLLNIWKSFQPEQINLYPRLPEGHKIEGKSRAANCRECANGTPLQISGSTRFRRFRILMEDWLTWRRYETRTQGPIVFTALVPRLAMRTAPWLCGKVTKISFWSGADALGREIRRLKSPFPNIRGKPVGG